MPSKEQHKETFNPIGMIFGILTTGFIMTLAAPLWMILFVSSAYQSHSSHDLPRKIYTNTYYASELHSQDLKDIYLQFIDKQIEYETSDNKEQIRQDILQLKSEYDKLKEQKKMTPAIMRTTGLPYNLPFE